MKTLLTTLALIASGVFIFYLWLRMPSNLKGVVFFWAFPLLGIYLIIGGIVSLFKKDED
ncbi:hypothetical protein [Aestuariibaculum lutulentum]|uniref:Uncharacterized protein n=1 Tax=Aestuariibaculum lutulentum TaxID=2920935 RepID=A0ABS9RGC0_9FLAO|nr:hypothetical protein [Aestuariibaculum lutulentum]MCH4551993.1 hypothetical protein [Aestuariibaculum lutulentum]